MMNPIVDERSFFTIFIVSKNFIELNYFPFLEFYFFFYFLEGRMIE